MLLISASIFALSMVNSTDESKKLTIVEGTVIDYTAPDPASHPSWTETKRIAGILRIKKKDGTTAEFAAWQPLSPPKSGWQKGQSVRIKHDTVRMLREVIVAGEVLQPLADKLEPNKYPNITQTIAFSLLVVSVSLMIVAYLRSDREK
jgi:hypothetical protein